MIETLDREKYFVKARKNQKPEINVLHKIWVWPNPTPFFEWPKYQSLELKIFSVQANI